MKRKSGKVTVRAEKGFALFISNEDMDNIMKIISLLEVSGVLIDGVTTTLKHKIKKESGFLGVLLAHLLLYSYSMWFLQL